MSKLKSVNLKAIKHNLRHALKTAALANDYPAVAKAAQAIYEAGYELEDMGFTPAFFSAVASRTSSAYTAGRGSSSLATRSRKSCNATIGVP